MIHCDLRPYQVVVHINAVLLGNRAIYVCKFYRLALLELADPYIFKLESWLK